ncbi:transposase [Catalinimonas niigatensis]|uniref:transposase n=1 Tax=Catalinimonas niigatensis TaxID=1397264 RepID=UPI00266624FD|nr:transposase [Catalinimonas niigatensis]WPP50830.1 transposase [Catalinimonas niigatensis]
MWPRTLLPKKKKLRLCIDRTELSFGIHQVKIHMVVVGYRDISVPLYWEMLDNNSGNSFVKGEVICWVFVLIGTEQIGLVIGDREFFAHQCFKYLKDRGIRFVMCLPNLHKIHCLGDRIQTVTTLVLTENKPLSLCNCLVDGVVGQVWTMLLEDGDYLFLFGTVEVMFMRVLYRKRWSIEEAAAAVCFQNMKKIGFNLEDTHLQDNNKLKKASGSSKYSLGFLC